MEPLQNILVILTFLSIFMELNVCWAAPTNYEKESLHDDAESITELLKVCNIKSSLCSEESRFHSTSVHSFRQSGVRKTSAIMMADILRLCIDKGVAGCDVENTVVALNALSLQHKRQHSSKKEEDQQKPKPFSETRLRRSLNLANLQSYNRISSLDITSAKSIHSIEKRALGGIIKQMIFGMCSRDPAACYDHDSSGRKMHRGRGIANFR